MALSNVTPDLTAHLQSLAPHTWTQLRLQERMGGALRALRYEDALSRASTAATLKLIQVEFAPLARTISAIQPPASLARANAAVSKAIEQMGAAAGELAAALDEGPKGRAARVERARAVAVESETSARTAANAITAALGVAAAAIATIPIVGPIIAAVLAVIAAVIVLIGQILAKAKEDEAQEKEKDDAPE